MTESHAVILTPQSRVRCVAQTGGSIPRGLALTLVPLDLGFPGEAWRHTDTRWSVTHIQSGKRVGPGFEERRDAQKVAEALYGVANWTLGERELLALPDIQRAVAATLDRVLTELDEGAL
jgi:hypothetical protein